MEQGEGGDVIRLNVHVRKAATANPYSSVDRKNFGTNGRRSANLRRSTVVRE
jgi:hypothetical protein